MNSDYQLCFGHILSQLFLEEFCKQVPLQFDVQYILYSEYNCEPNLRDLNANYIFQTLQARWGWLTVWHRQSVKETNRCVFYARTKYTAYVEHKTWIIDWKCEEFVWHQLANRVVEIVSVVCYQGIYTTLPQVVELALGPLLIYCNRLLEV